MIPLRQPVPVRGDIPGLLCRGTLLSDVILLDVDGLPVSMDNSIVISPEPGWTTVYGGIDEPGCERFRTLIWHSPIAIYAALHWLAERGHPCLWILPATHGGAVEPWDGLTAWDVSAILVSASVARVAEGGKPVGDLFAGWFDNGDTHERRSVRYDHARHEAVILCAYEGRRLWSGYGWDIFGEYHPCGFETGDAGMAAADAAALTDGVALLVPGGVAVLAPGAA